MKLIQKIVQYRSIVSVYQCNSVQFTLVFGYYCFELSNLFLQLKHPCAGFNCGCNDLSWISLGQSIVSFQYNNNKAITQKDWAAWRANVAFRSPDLKLQEQKHILKFYIWSRSIRRGQDWWGSSWLNRFFQARACDAFCNGRFPCLWLLCWRFVQSLRCHNQAW